MAAAAPGHVVTRLRPVRPDEAALLERWRAEPHTPIEAWGRPPADIPVDAPPPQPTGMEQLLVTDGQDVPVGPVGWHGLLSYSRLRDDA